MEDKQTEVELEVYDVVVVYLALVGELHQLLHKSRGMGALGFSHLLYPHVSLCTKNTIKSMSVTFLLCFSPCVKVYVHLSVC